MSIAAAAAPAMHPTQARYIAARALYKEPMSRNETVSDLRASLARMQALHLESLRAGDFGVADMRKTLCESIAARLRSATRTR